MKDLLKTTSCCEKRLPTSCCVYVARVLIAGVDPAEEFTSSAAAGKKTNAVAWGATREIVLTQRNGSI